MFARLLTLFFCALLAACSEDPEKQAMRQQLIDRALNDDTRKMGEAYLAENARQPGVVQLDSGLQYKVLLEGQGPAPGMLDSVRVDYTGKTVDGEVFDSQSGAVFPVKGVIRGWRQALLTMPVGSHWQLFIPADLAYGATSPTAQIPANSALIFDVKLLSIEPQESQ